MKRFLIPFLDSAFRGKRFIAASAILAASLSVMPTDIYATPELRFRGATLNVLSEVPERNTGLDKIYIVYDIKNVDILYNSSTPSAVKIYRYSNLGGGFAEEIDNTRIDGNDIVIPNAEGNMGYIVEDGDKRYYFWVVNYLPYRFSLEGVYPSEEKDCDATFIDVRGKGDAIHYFTINGQQKVLDREIKVIFDTQEWNADAKEFQTVESVKLFESLSPSMRISPPVYCSTAFHVEGDKFLRAWNWLAEAESAVIDPTAVQVMTEAVQQGRDDTSSDANLSRRRNRNAGRYITRDGEDDSDDSPASGDDNKNNNGSNEINNGEEGLGGSAPATIEFNAYVTQGVLHHEWQLTKDPEFEEIEYRFNQQNIEYTFMEEGTFYMRYVGSNSDGTCESVGDTFTISIGASELLCPNAFTPDGDGVNDEWKVSYRSLLDFECWIFDRYGAQLFHTKDPQQGWDGMRGGKVVPSGVYYYVIQATGADGNKYKKSGDINILRHRSVTSEGPGVAE